MKEQKILTDILSLVTLANMKLGKISIVILFLFIATNFAHATGQLKMIFWYPGEAGSTQEAKSTLDTFFEYINKKIAPAKIDGKYFNTTEEGLNFIKKEKPQIGILSFAAYTINEKKIGNTKKLLQTLPLPEGKATESYTVLGKGKGPTSWDGIPLYTKQPLTIDFVRRLIFANNTPNTLVSVANILPTLKDISSGAKKGGAILQPMEFYTIKNINQPWAKGLSVWYTSGPVPSAPMVIFGETTPTIEKIKNVLLKMSEDPEGKIILETLRLKGFSPLLP